MKFSVGYQFQDENGRSFAESLAALAPHIAEVYFPWPDSPSGRPSMVNEHGDVYWGGQEQLERDLRLLKKAGIKLNLLFNANCYGDKAVSVYLLNNVCSIIGRVLHVAGSLDWITTASPYIASIVKEYFPGVKTRASVNMRIGTIEGMELLADVFDGFYMQREYNRNFEVIKSLKDWCDNNNKSLHILVNSGCMAYCSAQIFHDNILAHDAGAKETVNKPGYEAALCRQYYAIPGNQWKLLRNTWIRPEDMENYDGCFHAAKLATRQTLRPLHVINAYIAGTYRGNLLDLLEPNHSPCLGENYISNSMFPRDWFRRTTDCNRNCNICGYCRDVFQRICVRPEIPMPAGTYNNFYGGSL